MIYLKLLIGAIVAFFLPLSTFLLSIGGLIILDMLIAISAAFVKNEKITSRKMSHTMIKILIYNCSLISVYIFQLNFFNDLDLVRAIAFFLTLIELKSIDENLKKGWGFSVLNKIMSVIKRADLNENKDDK